MDGGCENIVSRVESQEWSTANIISEDMARSDDRRRSNRFFYRHHEEPLLNLYHQEKETFPIPLNYVDSMRQSQTSINTVSEHIVNDTWTEAKGVNLSGEWPTYKAS